MQVKITAALKAQLDAAGPDDAKEFIDAFTEWKSGDEFGSYYFGKDGGYAAPPVGLEKYALQHVHLVPVSDKAALDKWDYFYEKGKRKTSNRVLVYVANKKKNAYLLIYILPEPDAHKIAGMRTQEDRKTMLAFAKIAEKFLDTGEILG